MNNRPLRAQMLPESYTDRELDLGRVFALDNGAFTYWQKGGRVDVPAGGEHA